MVRVISQETFDAVVKENMDDLGMVRTEAVKEAKEQFAAQGVDLANIVTEEEGQAEEHAVLAALEKLKVADTAEKSNLAAGELSKELSSGLPERVLATKKGAYQAIIERLKVSEDDGEKATLMHALAALLDGNPDPLEAEGFKVLLLGLSSADEALTTATLECVLNCCVRHEQNRQNLVKNGLLAHLDKLHERSPGQLLRVCRIWQVSQCKSGRVG